MKGYEYFRKALYTPMALTYNMYNMINFDPF